MKKYIQKYSTGKIVLVLFVLTTLVYVIMLTITIPQVAAFANGTKLLDMLPAGYNLEYVQLLFSTLGYEGRHAYLWVQLPVDMVYPLLFGITYCLLLAFLLQKINKQQGWLFFFCYLPLIAGAADYLENIGIITLLKQFPDITHNSVEMTSYFSVIKSSTTTVYFVVLLCVVVVLAWHWLKRRYKLKH